MFKLLDPNNDILDPEQDRVVFLGDYVDGGPQVKDVIDHLMQWEKEFPHWVFLYGNHEDLMLDALIYNKKRYGDFYLWWNQGGRATFKSYTDGMDAEEYEKAIMQPLDVIPKEHIDWLKDRPLYFEDDTYFYVHAGLMPDLSIEEHKKSLETGEYKDELAQKLIWIRDEFIQELDFDWGKKIIYGHTTFGEPLTHTNKIGIDTMGRFGGKLTAIELPDETFHQQDSLEDPSF